MKYLKTYKQVKKMYIKLKKINKVLSKNKEFKLKNQKNNTQKCIVRKHKLIKKKKKSSMI